MSIGIRQGRHVHINKCKKNHVSATPSSESDEEGRCHSLGLGPRQETITTTHSLGSVSTLAVQTFNALLSTGDSSFIHPPTHRQEAPSMCPNPQPQPQMLVPTALRPTYASSALMAVLHPGRQSKAVSTNNAKNELSEIIYCWTRTISIIHKSTRPYQISHKSSH